MTMGELATVAGTQLHADVPEILPLVIDAIQDGGSQTKRLVAVSTLGQVGTRWRQAVGAGRLVCRRAAAGAPSLPWRLMPGLVAWLRRWWGPPAS